MHTTPASGHTWRFFRTGGLDQVALESAADLLALRQLDQKLWIALSCPVKGLEIDEKTLSLIDTDHDGRIGVPEVIAAVEWAAARLREPGELISGGDALPLSAISATTPEGKMLLAAAAHVLAGKTANTVIQVADMADLAKTLAGQPLVGDGILTPQASTDPAVQALLADIVTSTGGTPRIGGVLGANLAQTDAFFTALSDYVAWVDAGAAPAVAVLGESTADAAAALRAVRAKVDDYFARCRVAAFDPRAAAAVNRNETEYAPLTNKDLTSSAEALSVFPLARVEAGRPLPLTETVNPAWAAAVGALRTKVLAPVLGRELTALSPQDWATVTERFAAHEAWLAAKPAGAVDKLGLDRCRAILASDGRAKLAALFTQDAARAPEFQAIADVERLARYYRDLRTLLKNFVNFADFYSRDRYATFQAGTLFLDSRSTELCIRVDAPGALAAMSKIYIAYCTCVPAGGGAPMTIAACFTQGDSDYLFVGRNGVFYDRKGRLWYAVITSIVDNPISIRQAFWSPYKKFLRFIEEQVAKRAAAADAEASGKLATAAEKTAHVDKAKPEPKKFDLALITGIGVALGSIGGFLVAVFGRFLDLPTWQLPFIVVALMLVISLPSMVIAALKLRQRTLGPLLEANGWAINGRVKINIPFGAALTELATLPPGAKRSLDDPYEDKEAARQKRRLTVLFVLLVLIAAAIAIRWDHYRRGHYFWQPAPAPAAAPAPAPTPPAKA